MTKRNLPPREVYECKCGCGLNITKVTVMFVVQSLSISLDEDVIITSGTRCLTHQKRIYNNMGKPPALGSSHLTGEAADVQVKGFSANRIIKELRALFGDQLYMYKINERTVHFDIRFMSKEPEI
jgi:uncharacterized protein YcbK (DUF882 family)